jgi:hypothetical protein
MLRRSRRLLPLTPAAAALLSAIGLADWYQIGLERLIPRTKVTGRHVGRLPR